MTGDPKPFDAVKFAAGVRDLVERTVRESRSLNLADAFKGAWLPGQYRRGDLVQHRGSAWLCIEDGAGKPGETSHWRLLVKGTRE